MQTSVVRGVDTGQQIIDLSIYSTHVGNEVLLFDDNGEGFDTRVFLPSRTPSKVSSVSRAPSR